MKNKMRANKAKVLEEPLEMVVAMEVEKVAEKVVAIETVTASVVIMVAANVMKIIVLLKI